MYIETRDPRYKSSIFNAVVAPRPIGWISTVDAQGRPNLAPFSYFNGMSATPPLVVFSCNAPADRLEKDTVTNVRATGEFVFNLVTFDLRERMNITSTTVPHGVDEFELAAIERRASTLVKPPRVAASPACFECRLVRVVDVEPEAEGERRSSLVIGRVLAMHIDDAYLDARGRFDTHKARPLARLDGLQYGVVERSFEMPRPAV